MATPDSDTECTACPPHAERCAHWGPFVVRLYPPSKWDAALSRWGVEGPGVIDVERSRREGVPETSMFLAHESTYSGRHDNRDHALLDFESRAQAMRLYEVPTQRPRGG